MKRGTFQKCIQKKCDIYIYLCGLFKYRPDNKNKKKKSGGHRRPAGPISREDQSPQKKKNARVPGVAHRRRQMD